MVQRAEIQAGQEYCCQANLNLYKSPTCQSLVTQAKTGRHLIVRQILQKPDDCAIKVCLCEDDYPGWLSADDAAFLTPTPMPYLSSNPSTEAIAAAIPDVIRFAHNAMAQTNTYLWGGTIGPNYDCSGLVQTAFASAGIILPRDSYQQEHFVKPIRLDQLKQGDLLFFGSSDRTTHVALYLGEGKYIHSSGKEQGRNGIGIDSIENIQDPISQAYYQQIRGAGRVVASYQPLKCSGS
ncbi:C40 family peptidase [Oscillatoria sp. CS-180]|uniref:C40 family peptidase n=1 Tax=Oscillatoria sp. CS-180 TaxID=3021720 RepID=UPI0023300F40|nr:C40 family peptidase [Oscillatoria sp. CS-180]MDB9525741.1 C40 family peptidase [Oscillatoria sp. CS-180]